MRWYGLVAGVLCAAAVARAGTFMGRLGATGDSALLAEAAHACWKVRTGVISGVSTVLCADARNAEVRVVVGGRLERLAGTGVSGFSGDGGLAVQARLRTPTDAVVDAAGRVYIADAGNGRLRAIDPLTRTIYTMATMTDPEVVLVQADGVLVADGGGYRLVKVAPLGCGSGGAPACVVTELATGVQNPVDLLALADGSVLVAERAEMRVRRLTGTTLTPYAGGGSSTADGVPATQARLSSPVGLGLDSAQNVYIADLGLNKVRRVGTSGLIQTFAGTGVGQNLANPLYLDDALQQPLTAPSGVAMLGNAVLIASDPDHTVYTFSLAAAVATATSTATASAVPTSTAVATRTSTATPLVATSTPTRLPTCALTATPQGPCV